MNRKRSKDKTVRILIAKVGLDGHDRGAKVIARGLMNAGLEVVFLGIRHTPSEIAQAALEEDVDCVGLSILSGAHLTLSHRVINELAKRGLGDKPVVVGGVIPYKDVPKLKQAGVKEVFRSGTSIKDVVRFIKQQFQIEQKPIEPESANRRRELQ